MSAGGGGSNQDVELNLAPIIDCFTVLITYLLVTASFITLASVDVSVSATNPSGAPPPAADAPPPMSMAMELKAGGEIGIQIRGGTEKKAIAYTVSAGGGSWDIAALTTKLEEIQQKWPSLTEVSITAEPTVIYKDIVNVLHEIQNVMPKVYISG
jgi:biopolymer transport protein ExbD